MPALWITASKRPSLFDLVGNCSCPSNGGEVPGDNSFGAGCRRDRVATSFLVSPVQNDLVAFDQESSHHPAKAIPMIPL
jgi:hypothetical protein